MRLSHSIALIFCQICFGNSLLLGQVKAPSMQELQDRYMIYLEETITEKRFEIEDLIPIYNRLDVHSNIDFSIRGYSLQDRPIYLVKYGHGDIPVLMWSQMHGDESTATMALLDLFNFLTSDNPADQAFLAAIRERLTLCFIPMLNPDGAAQFERKNAANIDLNRDALDLSNPESRLLKAVRDSLEPAFGFNLHDQSIYYRAGRNGKQVALAFLTPAYNYDKDINDLRLRSMKLIAHLRDSLKILIPGRIAIYDDSFEPRAFGDNIQKWGTSTVLIESGGYPDDPEKQYLRQLNFLTLIKALESIMTGSYTSKTVYDYQSIPENERKMLSLIIEDLRVPVENQTVKMDIGYLYHEKVVEGNTIYPSAIADVGDLSVYKGLKVFPAEDFDVIEGQWYPQSFDNAGEITTIDWRSLIRNGYLGFIVNNGSVSDTNPSSFFIHRNSKQEDHRLDLVLAPGKDPTFILQSKGTDLRWVVHNGKVYPIEQFITHVGESLKKLE